MQDSQSGSIHTRQHGVRGGSLTVAQAKSMVGVKADKDDDIYLPTPGMVEVGLDRPGC